MAFSEEEIDQIVAGIRAGESITLGGGRSQTIYGARRGELFRREVDDGYPTESTCSEAWLREVIASNPEMFSEVLWQPLRRRLRAALRGTDRQASLATLRDLLDSGARLQRGDLLAAALQWPDTRSEIIEETDGNALYHSLMSALGYDSDSVAAGEAGVRFFAAIEGMLRGRELRQFRLYRAGFRSMAGDFAGALEDLDLEDMDEADRKRELDRLADRRFRAAIAAAADDDTPRLVWADALLERSNPRGELIVMQCALAKLDEDDPARVPLEFRAEQLVALNPVWALRHKVRFARGFIDSVDVRWVHYADVAHELFDISPPIRELRFTTAPGDRMDEPERVLDDPRVEAVPSLDFVAQFDVDAVFGTQLLERLEGRFATLKSLRLFVLELSQTDAERIGVRPSLTSLDLGGSAIRGSLSVLLGGLKELCALRLADCALGDTDLEALPHLPQLAALDLSENMKLSAEALRSVVRLPVRRLRLAESFRFGDDGPARLQGMTALRELSLSRCQVGNQGLAALANLSLTSLDLEDNVFNEAGVSTLLNGPLRSSLHRLRLGTRIGSYENGDAYLERRRKMERTVARLLTNMPQLWELDLRGCDIDGETACALLDALPGLRSLRLGQCSLGDAGLAKLVAHSRFAELDVLELDRNALTPEAGAVLAKASRLPLHLILYANSLGDEGTRALAQSPAAQGIVDLDLRENQLTDAGADAVVRLTRLALLRLDQNDLSVSEANACSDLLGPRFTYTPPHVASASTELQPE